ncbi:MAG: GNAT family N-acetyltransferase [Pseudomonadota bacterium]
MGKAEIFTERLHLRPLETGDVAAVAKAANNFKVSKWLAKMPHPYTRKDAVQFIEGNKDNLGRVWAITVNEKFAGVIGIAGLYGIGYWLAEPYWGQGIASEAAEAVVYDFFQNPKATQILSGYQQDNLGSARIQEKLGFEIKTANTTLETLARGSVASVETVLTRKTWEARFGQSLQTKRLLLRAFSEQDIPDLQRIAGQEHVARQLFAVTVPWDAERVSQWIKASQFKGELGFRLAIMHQDRMIGAVGLSGNPKPTLMYFLGKDYWGQGFATEAAASILDYAFAQFECSEIHADHFHDNPASGRVLRKLGFAKIGEDMGNSAARLEPASISLYRLTQEAWDSRET